MKLIENFRHNKVFSFVLIFSSILWILSVTLFIVNNNNTEKELIDLEVEKTQKHYENTFNQIINKLGYIEVFVETTKIDNITVENFAEFASHNNMSNIGLINFSVAPNGIQEFYYSIYNDEFIAGHNLLTDERDYVREAVEYAIANNVVVINGPYELRQGGQAVVFRKAVYEEGNFVGLVNLVIDFDKLRSKLEELESNVVDIGVYEANDNLIFGTLIYNENLSYYDELDVENVDWLIGVEVTDEYKNRTALTQYIILVTSSIVYILVMILSTKFYRKNKKLLKTQEELIYFDNLTRLPNRRLLNIDIEFAIKKGEPFYLGFGDLDNFKNLNDILGHSIGDKYLVDISNRFHEITSDNLKIYRWGGDEFIFFFNYNNKKDTIKKLKSIYDIFIDPIIIKGVNYNVSMSIGVVNYPSHGETIDDLIKRADIVMYDIKSQHKNRFGFFEDKYLDNLQREVDFENKLNEYSLEDFEVYLQPVVATKTNEIIGFEALSRLFDKNGKLINTAEVVKVYERKGDIFKLDKYIVEQTCKYSVELKKEFNIDYIFSFNISPITLSTEYIQYLETLIDIYNINPKYFVIEIIETTGFKDINESIVLLNKLKSLGFRIAMDDFGMGYSSLSYITRLPLSIIKIDRNFVQNYQTNKFDKMLILTIRDISKSLGLDIIVEGIETEEQLKFITDIGAQFYQGYLHSKPMSFEYIIKILKKK